VSWLDRFSLSLTLGDFITPLLIGGSSSNFIGNAIYDSAINGGDLPFAAALAFVSIAIMAIYLGSLGGRRFRGNMKLSGLSRGAFAIYAALVVTFLLGPLLVIVLLLLTNRTCSSLPIRHWTTHCSRSPQRSAVRSSLWLS